MIRQLLVIMLLVCPSFVSGQDELSDKKESLGLSIAPMGIGLNYEFSPIRNFTLTTVLEYTKVWMVDRVGQGLTWSQYMGRQGVRNRIIFTYDFNREVSVGIASCLHFYREDIQHHLLTWMTPSVFYTSNSMKVGGDIVVRFGSSNHDNVCSLFFGGGFRYYVSKRNYSVYDPWLNPDPSFKDGVYTDLFPSASIGCVIKLFSKSNEVESPKTE